MDDEKAVVTTEVTAAVEEEKWTEPRIRAAHEMKQMEVQQLASKINDLEGEAHEHELVINTIKDLDPNRRCFRLVGGVLVERTVKEVLPAVTKNLEQIAGATKALKETFVEKRNKLEEFRKTFGITNAQQRRQADSDDDDDQESRSKGVLVG